VGIRLRLAIFMAFGVPCLVLFFTGCAVDEGEATKKILAHDPSFQGWVNERTAIRKKLDSITSVYNEKRRKVEAQILVLKEQKSDIKVEYLGSVEKIKKQLDPANRKLKQKILDMRNRLKVKEIEAGNIEKDIGEVSALIEKQNRLDLTREEMQVWNKRRSALIRCKGKLEKEISDLKKDIEITELKIKILKI